MNKKASYSQAKHAYLNQINYKIKKSTVYNSTGNVSYRFKRKEKQKRKNKALRQCCKFPDYRFKYKEKKKRKLKKKLLYSFFSTLECLL